MFFSAGLVIRQNLVLSLAYNITAAALAMTGHMSPILAAVLMPLNSITVVVSSYRAKTFERLILDSGTWKSSEIRHHLLAVLGEEAVDGCHHFLGGIDNAEQLEIPRLDGAVFQHRVLEPPQQP